MDIASLGIGVKEILHLVGLVIFVICIIIFSRRIDAIINILEGLLESPQKGHGYTFLNGYYQGRKVKISSDVGLFFPSVSMEPKKILNPPKAFSLDKKPTKNTQLSHGRIFFNLPFFRSKSLRIYAFDIHSKEEFKEILDELTVAAQRVETDPIF